jgi:cell volume regulation protein A
VVTLLTLESAFTDAIVIVLTISLLQITTVATDADPVSTALRSMASGFSVGAVVGLISGVTWARLLTSLGNQKYIDILTLCSVLAIYAMVESIGGNGAIAVLFFGLALANGRDILTMLRRPPPPGAETLPVHFMSELSFFMRTFFFVYLGFIATLGDYRLMLVGAGIAILLLAGRWAASWITAIRDQELRRNVSVLTFMLPRGLAAAVMAQLVMDSGFARGEALINVVTVTIICTVAIGGLGTLLVSRRRAGDPLEKLMSEKTGVSA